jgi:hypothetical protein
MAKVSIEDRHLYFEKIRAYRGTIQDILDQEKEILAAIAENPENAALKRLILTDEMLNLSSYYILLNDMSQSMLKVKNEVALNDARKSLYKSIIYLEETVSNLVDAPFSEYEDKVFTLESVDAARRYHLIRKIGMAIDLLENAYGDNTKWRWAFVEMEARYAAVAKNILNLRKAVINTDPRSPEYEPTVYHLRLIKQLLARAAGRYREMYELSTNRFEDFRIGIHFLGALRRIHAVLGERKDAEVVKKKYDVWSAKLETDLRKKEEPASRKAQDVKVVS